MKKEPHTPAPVIITRQTLLVLSGYSGTGKTTIRDRILAAVPGSRFSLSLTTRPKREHEEDGVDYHFISRAEFEKMAAEGRFLEWEKVHGHFYGTPLQPLESRHGRPALVIFDVDVKGGLSIKKHYPEALLVFLKPPSLEELRKRLTERHTDSPEAIERRLKRIPVEENLSQQYDYIITNSSIDRTVDKVCALVRDFQDEKSVTDSPRTP